MNSERPWTRIRGRSTLSGSAAVVEPESLPDGLNKVDEIFEQLEARRVAPGIAYGVVIDGELALSRGLGTTRDGVDRRPDQDSVFRIASMTKSFTAAAVMLLRDERPARGSTTPYRQVDPRTRGPRSCPTERLHPRSRSNTS